MKKRYFVLLVLSIFGKYVLGQVSPGSPVRQPDIPFIEKQAHQRVANLTGIGSLDSLTVASDNFNVHHYRCEWELDPSVRYIKGKVTVSFVVNAASDKIILDLLSQLVVDSIYYHGAAISFQRVLKDGLQIQFPAALNAGEKDSVSIFYQGVPDPLRTGAFFQGFHRLNDAIWTLSEPYGSKTWWPCKNGLSDKADSIDILVTHPTGHIISTNGMLVSEQPVNGKIISHYKHGYPIVSYLVAVLLARYTVTKDSVQLGNQVMPVLMYSYPQHAGYFLEATRIAKQCLQKFSDLFGQYPFSKEHYAQTHWGTNGGMEHQTNSFIIDRWPELVSHELGHQWFGDKVTCGSWQDLWLNEGFATYTTNIYFEHFNTAMLRRTLQSLINSVTSQPGGSVWVDDTTNVSRLFSSRLTYNKGSYVVHMLRWVLGDSVFYKGVRRYLDDAALKYSFARTVDLKKALETESGKNLESFFQKWIYGQGYPDYHAAWSINNNNWIKVKLNQTTSHSSVSFFEMPVTIVAKAGTQERRFVVDHRYSGQEFWLNATFIPDTILIDPDLWILSKNKTSAKVASSSVANELKIFPNPAPDILKIALNNPTAKKLTVRFINTLGQTVYQKELQTPGNDELIEISLSHLPKAVYWMSLTTPDGEIKILKKIFH